MTRPLRQSQAIGLRTRLLDPYRFAANIRQHFDELGDEGRRSRFRCTPPRQWLDHFCAPESLAKGVHIGVIDQSGAVVALAQVFSRKGESSGEIAVSVVPDHRQRGLGRRLCRDILHTSALTMPLIKEVELMYLTNDLAMDAIARRLGGLRVIEGNETRLMIPVSRQAAD